MNKWMILALLFGVVSLQAEQEEYTGDCYVWGTDGTDVEWWDKPFWCTVECDEPVWVEWLVEKPPLFRPFLADPRQITMSAGWRFNDNTLVKNVIPVSYAGSIYFCRFYNVWPWCGQLQIELEGALWAVFDPLHDSSPLIDADYYVGVPITYAINRWQFRLRGYHISTHIGDEFLLNHPFFRRKNPSAEYLDFYISHDVTDEIRIYSGVGTIVHQDESFRMSRFFAGLGGEVRLYGLGFYDECQKIYGAPVFGMFMRYLGTHRRHVDMTYALGYELGKLEGLERRLRVLLEYHDGYSPDGQFSRYPTNYFQVLASYGF